MAFSNELDKYEEKFPETFGRNINDKAFGVRMSKLVSIHNAFLSMFEDSVYVGTRRVNGYRGKGSISLPSKFKDHPVTIIVWPKGQFSFSKDYIDKNIEDLESFENNEDS